MEVELHRSDLRDDVKDISFSLVKYEHFEPKVQAMIVLAGKAVFYVNRGRLHESSRVVYPPDGFTSASHFVNLLREKIDNGGISDQDFRDLIRNSIDTVK